MYLWVSTRAISRSVIVRWHITSRLTRPSSASDETFWEHSIDLHLTSTSLMSFDLRTTIETVASIVQFASVLTHGTSFVSSMIWFFLFHEDLINTVYHPSWSFSPTALDWNSNMTPLMTTFDNFVFDACGSTSESVLSNNMYKKLLLEIFSISVTTIVSWISISLSDSSLLWMIT